MVLVVLSLLPACLGYTIGPIVRSTCCTTTGVRMCAAQKPVQDMRVKELKAELDGFGVAWRGAMFDKETLAAALEAARAAPPPPSSQEAAPQDSGDEPSEAASAAAAAEPAPAAGGSDDDAAAYEAAYEAAYADCLQLKVKELRTELAARSVGWADLFEKEELAARLAGLKARAATFSPSGALTPGEVSPVGGAELRLEMADARTPLLVDVYATWCGPCKMISPMLAKVAAAAGERARFVKMDSDAEPELSTQLRVAGLPTLLFYRDGQEVHRLEGVPPGQGALEGLVKEHLGIEL